MDYSKISSIKLYLIRTPGNADEIDAELDRRNREAARKITKSHKQKEPKWKMIDYEYENNRFYLDSQGQYHDA